MVGVKKPLVAGGSVSENIVSRLIPSGIPPEDDFAASAGDAIQRATLMAVIPIVFVLIK